ncbi:FAD-binding oxidoreductase [Billgrantia tianxiuensis]|uniref:FAD-binding oxidoreductase n=1 Tax=Billgrantia tianxiuensis TaxID=2497861 RepID=UPI001F4229BA|nr:FAD-binding oxidoreductase [Halomonas tianxiuensis]
MTSLTDKTATPNARVKPVTELAARLTREMEGEVLFDLASRGRYSTDASIYQAMPVGVVIPRHQRDLTTALEAARDARVPILARGAGTSQCGQTVGEALVIDTTRWLREIVEFDREAGTVVVEPGIVLDHLNAWLKPHGLWYPVDVSTSAQCTLGGWPATTPAARARSATATWCTTCWASRPGWPTAARATLASSTSCRSRAASAS